MKRYRRNGITQKNSIHEVVQAALPVYIRALPISNGALALTQMPTYGAGVRFSMRQRVLEHQI